MDSLTPTGTPSRTSTALANLLTLLSDPGKGFFRIPMTYGIGGGDSNLRQMLFQKRNGTFYLALWLAESSYNLKTHQILSVTPEVLTVQLPTGHAGDPTSMG